MVLDPRPSEDSTLHEKRFTAADFARYRNPDPVLTTRSSRIFQAGIPGVQARFSFLVAGAFLAGVWQGDRVVSVHASGCAVAVLNPRRVTGTGGTPGVYGPIAPQRERRSNWLPARIPSSCIIPAIL